VWKRASGLSARRLELSWVDVFQALLLSRSEASGAFWWALANPPAWALGWLVTSYVITRNAKTSSRTCAGGSLVYELLTWLLLAVCVVPRDPEATRAQSH
jgi:hypothetical protein